MSDHCRACREPLRKCKVEYWWTDINCLLAQIVTIKIKMIFPITAANNSGTSISIWPVYVQWLVYVYASHPPPTTLRCLQGIKFVVSSLKKFCKYYLHSQTFFAIWKYFWQCNKREQVSLEKLVGHLYTQKQYLLASLYRKVCTWGWAYQRNAQLLHTVEVSECTAH